MCASSSRPIFRYKPPLCKPICSNKVFIYTLIHMYINQKYDFSSIIFIDIFFPKVLYKVGEIVSTPTFFFYIFCINFPFHSDLLVPPFLIFFSFFLFLNHIILTLPFLNLFFIPFNFSFNHICSHKFQNGKIIYPCVFICYRK